VQNFTRNVHKIAQIDRWWWRQWWWCQWWSC